MLDKNELAIQQVGKNEFVIRRDFLDEQGRRNHSFLAHFADNTHNNLEIAQEFLDGIEALQEKRAVEHSVEPTRDSGEAIPGVCDEIEELWAE